MTIIADSFDIASRSWRRLLRPRSLGVRSVRSGPGDSADKVARTLFTRKKTKAATLSLWSRDQRRSMI